MLKKVLPAIFLCVLVVMLAACNSGVNDAEEYENANIADTYSEVEMIDVDNDLLSESELQQNDSALPPELNPQTEDFPINDDTNSIDAQDSETENGIVHINSVGCFGFADWNELTDEGYRIIVPEYSKDDITYNVAELNIAIGAGGTITEIEFLGWQNETAKNNHRQTGFNFDNLSGNVFHKTIGSLNPHESYFLTNEAFKDSLIPLMLTQEYLPHENYSLYSYRIPIDSATVKRIEMLKNRKIVKSELLAKTLTGAQICSVTFERIDNDMLASLIYIDKNNIICDDYPAKEDGWDIWRVGAGDEFGGFDVLFLAHTDEGLIMAVTWSAEEGEHAYILVEKDGIFANTQFDVYRYWYPE